MARPAVALLSSQNLLHNLGVIQEKAGPAQIIAMIKANAYGHGLRSVGLRLCGRVSLLGVASIDEALALRQAGVNTPILLMEGPFSPDDVPAAAHNEFHLVLHTHDQLDWLSHAQSSVSVWIKVDTGMGRLGFSPEETPAIYERLSRNPCVATPVRLMSHFACADDQYNPLNQQQISRFQSLANHLSTEASFCNSAALFQFPDQKYDYIRPGLILYGVSPFPGMTGNQLGLKPVMTLKSHIMAVKIHDKGHLIGYGSRYRCPEKMPVGVVALGYGDGYPLTAKDGTPILVNGVECPLVGRVSMDMLTVDLRPCPSARTGDPVVLWGEGLPVERVTSHTHTISWDLLTSVQHRVRFQWMD